MRVLYVTRRAWPALGGIESLVRHVARGVAQDHQVAIVALRVDNGPISRTSDGPRLPEPFDPFIDGDVSVLPLRLSRSQRIALAPLLLQEVPLVGRLAFGAGREALSRLYAQVVAPQLATAAATADIVHVWSDGFPAAAAILAARRVGCPAVVTPFMHRHAWGDDVASVGAYRRADRVLALLDPEAQEYEALGVSSERVMVSGACSAGVATADGLRLRRQHGINGPLVLFLGMRSEHKGLGLLLEAAAHLPSTVTVAFVGPGPPLRGASRSTGARILDVGRVSEGERAEWLHASDLLCLPSASETFGLVVLEAWSAGTPVLTSDIPSLRGLVGPSGGGVLVQRNVAAIGDALNTLLQEPGKLEAMGAAGRQHWLKHFTVERVAAWHLALYEELRENHETHGKGSRRGLRAGTDVS